MRDQKDSKLALMLVWPVAGFFVVIAFGVGMISMAAFNGRSANLGFG